MPITFIAPYVGQRPIRPIGTVKKIKDNFVRGNYYKLITPTIEFNNFNVFELYFKNDINIGNISILKPSIEIVNKLKQQKSSDKQFNSSMEIDLSKLIAGKLNSVKVDNSSKSLVNSNWRIILIILLDMGN